MGNLNDLRIYAKEKGMSEYTIDRIIDEAETDENGNVIHYEEMCFGIDCETEDI